MYSKSIDIDKMEELVQHASLEDIKRDIHSLNTLVLTRLAAKYNRLDILECLKGLEIQWSTYTYDYAAKAGHLDLLIWLKKNISDNIGGESVCYSASMIGRLDILLWSLKNEFPCDTKQCYFAAVFYNRVNVIEYLHILDKDVCRDNFCKVCNRKKSIVTKLIEESNTKTNENYLSWLSPHLIRELTE
jgi:hypothetical protein